MELTVRLYKKHDLDLLELKARENFSIGKQIKNTLRAYIKGENYIIPVPEQAKPDVFLKDERLHIYLNGKEDRDIINFILKIKPGFRNSAIKLILRNYLGFTNLIPYILPGEDIPVSRKKPAESETVKKEPVSLENEEKWTIQQDKDPGIKKQVAKNSEAHEKKEKEPEYPLQDNSYSEVTDKDDNDDFNLFSAVDKLIGNY